MITESALTCEQFDQLMPEAVYDRMKALAMENSDLDNHLKVKRLISLFSIGYAVKSNYKRKAMVNAAIMGYLVDGVNISELELLLQDPEMDIKKELMYFKRSMENFEVLRFVTQFYTSEDFLDSLYLLSQTSRFEKTAGRVVKTLKKRDFFKFKNLDQD